MNTSPPNQTRLTFSTVPLITLVVLCVLAHLIALACLEGEGRTSASLTARGTRCKALIDFINDHGGLAQVYVAFFLGSLIWLEVRRAPRWALWMTFAALTLPCLAYIRACLWVGGELWFRP